MSSERNQDCPTISHRQAAELFQSRMLQLLLTFNLDFENVYEADKMHFQNSRGRKNQLLQAVLSPPHSSRTDNYTNTLKKHVS